MKKLRVYDLPTRLFHWLFAGLFIGAFFIANVIDDESALYPYHMMMGMVMVLAVTLRVIWGIIGSKYARFSSFILNPKALLDYLKALFNAGTERKLGRNPASSWAAIAMMLFTIGLATTGVLMALGGDKDILKEVHELLAYGFLIVAIAHVTGIIIHTLKHKDAIGLSMVHGTKDRVDHEQGIAHNHTFIGIIFIVCVGVFSTFLLSNYSPSTQTLSVFGKTLQLGENEEEMLEQGFSEESEHDDD